ncbi:MAG: hypothetical protein EOM40_15480 [Clostridia bacterium]|nr:hypothetical protein [Clostridia bacterium]NCC43934.1 hypothetical protein [Clostridia bacterium]
MNYWISGYGAGTEPTILFMDDNASPIWSASIPNPSFLCETADLLFAVGEFDDHCTVTSFKKNTDTSDNSTLYTKKDSIRLEGTALCHLSAHPGEHFLAGSCWGNGLFFTVAYHDDGTFGDIIYQEYQSDGTDHTSRVHCALISDEWIYVVNIELDLIYCYHLEQGTPVFYSKLALPKGTGPRHIYENKENHLIYCVTEYSSQLLTIDHSDRKNMKLLSSLSLLDPAFSGTSYGSTLTVTKDQNHLYAANRGENTIAHFILGEDGMPSFQDRFSCLGDWPRHIALLDDDKYLAVANQNNGEVVFLTRSPDSGILSQTAVRKISLPGASFIAESL